jgi:hypothetical protein
VERGATVVAELGRVGDVLVHRAPERDREQLVAPADREHGHLPPDRAARQRHLARVAVGVHPVDGLARRRAVARGIDVAAAEQEETVDAREQCAGLGIVERERLEHRFPATRPVERGEVRLGHPDSGVRPALHPAGPEHGSAGTAMSARGMETVSGLRAG